MNKDEIRQQIKEARERHNKELKALEAKLNEPEKWEPKGGDYRVRLVSYTDFEVISNDVGSAIEKKYRAKTFSEAKDLAAHLKRQAILWQLANDLNYGWEPDWDNQKWDKFYLYFDHDYNCWGCNEKVHCEIPTVYFKDYETAKKACEILNNQPELFQ